MGIKLGMVVGGKGLLLQKVTRDQKLGARGKYSSKKVKVFPDATVLFGKTFRKYTQFCKIIGYLICGDNWWYHLKAKKHLI